MNPSQGQAEATRQCVHCGKPVRSRADAEYFVEWIDRTLERAMKLSFNNIGEREETEKLYREARAKMVERAAEAGR